MVGFLYLRQNIWGNIREEIFLPHSFKKFEFIMVKRVLRGKAVPIEVAGRLSGMPVWEVSHGSHLKFPIRIEFTSRLGSFSSAKALWPHFHPDLSFTNLLDASQAHGDDQPLSFPLSCMSSFGSHILTVIPYQMFNLKMFSLKERFCNLKIWKQKCIFFGNDFLFITNYIW